MTSLSGLLGNAIGALAEADRSFDRDQAYNYQPALFVRELERLHDNLLELRTRTQAGDLSALDEFFGLYVVEGETYSRAGGAK